ncbi:MAG: hypothetical protein JRE18_00525 [Deltaproteobacteria bacterium]|nr:hypothetical protein [Deltaproteobacteria bacterium]
MEVVLLLNNRTGVTSSKKVDRVFIAIGYEPAVELARKTEVELTEDGFIKCDAITGQAFLESMGPAIWRGGL